MVGTEGGCLPEPERIAIAGTDTLSSRVLARSEDPLLTRSLWRTLVWTAKFFPIGANRSKQKDLQVSRLPKRQPGSSRAVFIANYRVIIESALTA